jgi:hypothetical protein
MAVELPTEILELVVDFHPDLRTLIQCSLAGRVFVPRSRVHLFRKITFPSPGSHESVYPTCPTRCDLFAELLISNPRLVHHVHELEIVEGGHPSLDVYWISQSTSLLSILRVLLNLQSFALRCHLSEQSNVLIEALSIIMHLPSIASVEFSGLEVGNEEQFLSIFNGVDRTLQSLHISNLLITFPSSGAEPSPHRPLLRVDTLDLTFHKGHDMEALFVDILSTSPFLDMSVLRHLRLTVYHNDYILIEQWLEQCAESLEELELMFLRMWYLPQVWAV